MRARQAATTALLLTCVLTTGPGCPRKGGGSGGPAFELANGLHVILQPAPKTANTALLVLFDVGSDHDPKDESGIGHLVEHVYVTAAAGTTPARSAREFMQHFPAGGNAQTGNDYTVVAGVFPNSSLDAELADAAARMGDLKITDADLAREKPRLLTEVGNMFGNLPALAARNQARSMVSPAPRGGRHGGVPSQVEALTLDQVREHWRRYYKPNNATLVLVGDFDPTVLRPRIESLFGSIPAGEALPTPGTSPGPVAETNRIVHVHPPMGGPRQSIAGAAFAAPPLGAPDWPAFLVNAMVLMQGGTGTYSMLDDPSVILVVAPVGSDTPEAAARRVLETTERALRADASTARPAAVGMATAMLGLQGYPPMMVQNNPYGVAFSLARVQQLGLDRPSILKDVNGIDDSAIAAAREKYFAPEAARTAVIVVQ